MGQQRLSKGQRKQIVKARKTVKLTGERESEKYLSGLRRNYSQTFKVEREYA